MEDIMPIIGFPGYFASKDGRIFSTWRRSSFERNPATGHITRTTFSADGALKELCPHPMRKGGKRTGKILATYVVLKLPAADTNSRRKCKYRNRNIHQLILETFVGPCPEGLEACHNDGNAENNALDNLRWDTKKSNQADRVAHGTDCRGSKSPNAMIDESIAAQIKRRLADGLSRKMVAAELNVSIHIVADIKRNRAWRHVAI